MSREKPSPTYNRARTMEASGRRARADLSRMLAQEQPISYVLEATGVGAATDMDLAVGGGGAMTVGVTTLPVARYLRGSRARNQVAASWTSDTTPSGNWTLTLWRRPAGGSFSPVATATILTA